MTNNHTPGVTNTTSMLSGEQQQQQQQQQQQDDCMRLFPELFLVFFGIWLANCFLIWWYYGCGNSNSEVIPIKRRQRGNATQEHIHNNLTALMFSGICMAISYCVFIFMDEKGFEVTMRVVFFVIPFLIFIMTAILVFTDIYWTVPHYKRDFEADNMFMNFEAPHTRVVLVGASQLILISMYVYGIWQGGGPANYSQSRVYINYLLAAFLEQLYFIGKGLWSPYKKEVLFWKVAYRLSVTSEYRRQEEPTSIGTTPTYETADTASFESYWTSDKHEDGFVIRRKYLHVRFLLHVFANWAGLWIIFVGLPISAANIESDVDFVLNVLSAFFIIELDDLGNSVKFRVEYRDNDRPEDSLDSFRMEEARNLVNLTPDTTQPYDEELNTTERGTGEVQVEEKGEILVPRTQHRESTKESFRRRNILEGGVVPKSRPMEYTSTV